MKRKNGDIRSNRKLNFENPLHRKWYTEIIIFVSDRRFYGTRNHLSLSDWSPIIGPITCHFRKISPLGFIKPAHTTESKLSRIVTVNVIYSHLVISDDSGTPNSAANSTANSAASTSSNSQNPVVSKPNSYQPEADLNFPSVENNATFHSLKILVIILSLINFL